VAGTHDVRAFVGPFGEGAIATVWHFVGQDGQLLVDTSQVQVFDVRGQQVEASAVDGKVAVPVDHRRLLLHFPDQKPEAVKRLLSGARLELRKPGVIWLQAEHCQRRDGAMVNGSQAGLRDPDAVGDFVVCNGAIDRTGRTPNYCEYRVAIPHQGRWTLWARVRYPTGGDMSFGIVLPQEEVTLAGRQVLGNCGANEARWHWTGQGGGVTTVPPGTPLVFVLEPGEFIFRIYPREGPGTAAGNPRLDCLCLSEDPSYRPTDSDARSALAGQ
jgi:hypothetical protein